MSEIIWSEHIARHGKRALDQDISIRLHDYSKNDKSHGTSFGIIFRNDCYKQITKTGRVEIGLWSERDRLYFIQAPEGKGYRLSTNGASETITTRYCSIHQTVGRRHPEILEWLMNHQGDYYLNFDKNGAFVTADDDHILWATRA